MGGHLSFSNWDFDLDVGGHLSFSNWDFDLCGISRIGILM